MNSTRHEARRKRLLFRYVQRSRPQTPSQIDDLVCNVLNCFRLEILMNRYLQQMPPQKFRIRVVLGGFGRGKIPKLDCLYSAMFQKLRGFFFVRNEKWEKQRTHAIRQSDIEESHSVSQPVLQ